MKNRKQSQIKRKGLKELALEGIWVKIKKRGERERDDFSQVTSPSIELGACLNKYGRAL